MKRSLFLFTLVTALMLAMLVPTVALADEVPGLLTVEPKDCNTLNPMVSEHGLITLSVDAAGSDLASHMIYVDKPSAGATVRSAYLMAATYSGSISTGDVTLDGNPIAWDSSIVNVLWGYNYWTDATALVAPKVDAAIPGLVPFELAEVGNNIHQIDGEILAVIFDDPAQAASNTVILMFGTQQMNGDTFNIGWADPVDTGNPNLVMDMSLGISYSYQTPSAQYSIVDVNSQRLSTSAGGQDDGIPPSSGNGRLITAGGIGDSNANPPDPYQIGGGSLGALYDDELYNIIPFVNNGDTSVTVYTQNPSNDDNVFFAGLFLGDVTAVVGEGIVLSPPSAINDLGMSHTVTALVQDDDGNPVADRDVTFNIVSGPNAGTTEVVTTGADGKAAFVYTSLVEGTDVIVATFLDSQDNMQTSNRVTKTWVDSVPPVPELPPVLLLGIGLIGIVGYVGFKRLRNSQVMVS